MVTATISESTMTDTKQAEDIPPINKQEAAEVAAFELEQVLNLLEQLDGEDWTQPTDCTEWNVQDMTAHLAGACAGWASLGQFVRQTLLNPFMRQTDIPIDAINRRQLEDRSSRSPQQHIDELRSVGPKAVRNRRKLPGLLRKIRIDAKPMPGKMSMAYLVDVIYPRDQWMHRMDICRATDRELVITPAHDGRLLDLVVRDMANKLEETVPVMVNVTGALKVSYRFGRSEPEAELYIDFHEFNRLASMRISVDEALQTTEIRGDRSAAEEFLRNCPVLY